jgi:microcystin-dependent protein
MKIKSLITAAGFSVIASTTLAQVGIGVALPNSNSILDLTNGNSKGLLLPISPTSPSAATYPEAMLLYFDGMLYVRNDAAFNGITPWKYKYNGSTNEAVYFNPTSYVGVGIGVNDAALRGNLHISLNGKDAGISGTSAAIFVGNDDTGTHMLIDNDEILVKTNTTTGGILKLQEGGGSVQVGQNISTPSNLNVFGKVKENGNDLLPQGVVVMWSGALNAIPHGWAICDGQRYQINTTTGNTELVATGGFQTPDLRERFIVGAASTDNTTVTGTAYAAGANGGLNEVTLTEAQMPSHSHSGTALGAGGHSHNEQRYNPNCYDVVASGQSGCWLLQPGSIVNQQTSFVADHTHTLSINNTGGGGAHENRPPYYALAFIVKL